MSESMNLAIEAWCASITDAHAEELADHLRCVMEARIREGDTEQEAFAFATAQLGDPSTLSAEYARNPPEVVVNARQVLAHALFFAAAMLLTSWFTRGTDQGQTLTFLWIAAWFATAPTTRGQAASELACLRRRFAWG